MKEFLKRYAHNALVTLFMVVAISIAVASPLVLLYLMLMTLGLVWGSATFFVLGIVILVGVNTAIDMAFKD